jgi:hypothetical protein
VGYEPELQAARAREDWPACAAILERALRFVPDEVELALATGALARRKDEALASLFAQVYAQHATALRELGREADAQRSDERARRLRALAPPAPAGNREPGD